MDNTLDLQDNLPSNENPQSKGHTLTLSLLDKMDEDAFKTSLDLALRRNQKLMAKIGSEIAELGDVTARITLSGSPRDVTVQYGIYTSPYQLLIDPAQDCPSIFSNIFLQVNSDFQAVVSQQSQQVAQAISSAVKGLSEKKGFLSLLPAVTGLKKLNQQSMLRGTLLTANIRSDVDESVVTMINKVIQRKFEIYIPVDLQSVLSSDAVLPAITSLLTKDGDNDSKPNNNELVSAISNMLKS